MSRKGTLGRPWRSRQRSSVPWRSGASNLVWNRAIATIGVARTAVFLYWVPIFGVLFAAVLLGEHLTLWHLGGFAAVMAGTYLGTHQPLPSPPVPS